MTGAMLQEPSATRRPSLSRSDRTLNPKAAWAAVLARDASSDGRFVYAVATTGVYCRPSCRSRRPLERNVRFFALPDQAEAAGFRACRRCRPRQLADRKDSVRVERVRAYLESHTESSVSLAQLAQVVGLSPFHLQRLFKRAMGVTPKQYQQARRTQRLKARLREGSSVARAAYEAGYGSSSGAYEDVAGRLGMTPTAYRKGGAGVRIRYAIEPSPLGQVLVAATDHGICSVALGADPNALTAELRREFPRAELEPARADLHTWVEAIVRHLSGNRTRPALPLDLQATAFQMRVWKALQSIPYGATRSYRQIAVAIGSPSAARAVAGACARNPVAVLIPCHRVVREDGSLGGYHWGLERKRQLLAQERQAGAG
jgi:AraC family transcriptional regulator of adaptative response/methylated-DNA-[protein]-cysteine methyltransferase